MADSLEKAFAHFLEQHAVSLDAEFTRTALHTLAQALMELEVAALTGADRHERSAERQVYRNGYRKRTWRTHAGAVLLNIPKLRRGTYYPGFIAPETEAVLRDLTLRAFAEGVTREAVEAALNRLGFDDVHASKLTEICERLDNLVAQARQKPLDDVYVYTEIHLNVLDVEIERGGRVTRRQLATAIGERESGQRELLAHTITTRTDAVFWTDFMRDLERRGLNDVRRVITNADGASEARWAIWEVFASAEWLPFNARAEILSVLPLADGYTSDYLYLPYAA